MAKLERKDRNFKFETLQLHVGQEQPDPVTDARAVPIYQTSSYVFRNSQHAADRFGLKDAGNIYGRLTNPTEDVFEKRIAALEGGSAALAVASGAAAIAYTIENLAQNGDHIVAAKNIYGGTFNLISVTFKKMGIDVTFVSPDASEEELNAAFKHNTRAMFGETIANPALTVLDIEKFAKVAHTHNVPLIVDNTFPTPINCRPIEWGADIVTHSTTKYMDGHAVQVGGVVVDSGKFDWAASEKFPEFVTPDDSYHGLIYTKAFGNMAYIVKARVQIMRDLGLCQTAQGAFYINLGLETLALRIRRHSENALVVAKYLEKHPKVSKVIYAGLESSPFHELSKKYLKDGLCSGVLSLELKGGRQAGSALIDHVKMASPEVHVADIRTCLLHPASSTHRQLTDEQLTACGITPGLVRLSVGLESLEDIIADLEQALAQV